MLTKIDRPLSDYNSQLKLSGFNAFQIESDGNSTKVYSRKDFYKICITTGRSRIHYSDKTFEQDGTVLFFGNPHIPYSWETLTTTYVGYTCLFSEDFLKAGDRMEFLRQSPFFQLEGTPILCINEIQREVINQLFIKMIEEQESNYSYKDELIRNYIHLILHEAMKMQPLESKDSPKNAASRITSVFLELLERQFPIETPDLPLHLRTAQDYASSLSVHVNHLNRSLKEATGKSTSTLINERILREAKALLQHTNWNISEIAFALGFEYPTYFNNFFKKMTGFTPRSYRDENV